MLQRVTFLFVLIITVLTSAAQAAANDFQPDPASVQRYGKGYRYPQAGWIVLHIEGEPYDRGVQHGRLLAPEIAGHVRCFAAMQSPKAPADGWKLTRTLCNALFQRRYHKEYLEEMKGIADGAAAVGAKFDGRPIDLLDIVALNSWAEVDTLDAALDATPTGLEGIRFPQPKPKTPVKPKGDHCSAFAATGPATRDGKIVFGHITMFALYPGNFYNLWLDVKPAKGHRVFMQSYPGGIQSGMDYYFNDAGLLVSETTISQTKYDATGLTVASRIRQALQYADSIDKVVEILKEGNNGLYTNEWLLADTKTNEIAMFELGTGKSRLYRSSKQEWFGGTEGFYWGCNNTKDLQVRLETLASTDGRPASAVFRPSDRDKTWLRLYDVHKGKIDADFGKLAFTTPPLASFHSLDAKFTTSDLVKEQKTWALYGPPLGKTWQPSFEERQKYPEIQPLVGNDWTMLHADAPVGSAKFQVVDMHDVEKPTPERKAPDNDPSTVPAWHGTILPRTDADIWLAVAFAKYEPIAALENALREKNDGKLLPEDRERLELSLFAHRTNYNLGARAGVETPLAKIKADLRQDWWHRVAAGKGVLLLHELRKELGAAKFDALMDDFGRAHAGKPVGVEEFRVAVEKTLGPREAFFEAWLTRTGLPFVKVGANGGPFSVLTFHDELDKTLIVYGTGLETNVNREAVEALQQAVRERRSNYTIPAKSDREVSDEELKSHHVLLIGRPDNNAVLAKWQKGLPIAFGFRSFTVRGETYAHAESAVIASAVNPLNARFSTVAIVGLSGGATLRAAPLLVAKNRQPTEVVVLPHNQLPRSLLIPCKAEK